MTTRAEISTTDRIIAIFHRHPGTRYEPADMVDALHAEYGVVITSIEAVACMRALEGKGRIVRDKRTWRYEG